MEPLLTQGPTVVAGHGTVSAHRANRATEADWVEAMAGATPPRVSLASSLSGTRVAAAPTPQDDGKVELSVADAVASAATDWTMATPAESGAPSATASARAEEQGPPEAIPADAIPADATDGAADSASDGSTGAPTAPLPLVLSTAVAAATAGHASATNAPRQAGVQALPGENPKSVPSRNGRAGGQRESAKAIASSPPIAAAVSHATVSHATVSHATVSHATAPTISAPSLVSAVAGVAVTVTARSSPTPVSTPNRTMFRAAATATDSDTAAIAATSAIPADPRLRAALDGQPTSGTRSATSIGLAAAAPDATTAESKPGTAALPGATVAPASSRLGLRTTQPDEPGGRASNPVSEGLSSSRAERVGKAGLGTRVAGGKTAPRAQETAAGTAAASPPGGSPNPSAGVSATGFGSTIAPTARAAETSIHRPHPNAGVPSPVQAAEPNATAQDAALPDPVTHAQSATSAATRMAMGTASAPAPESATPTPTTGSTAQIAASLDRPLPITRMQPDPAATSPDASLSAPAAQAATFVAGPAADAHPALAHMAASGGSAPPGKATPSDPGILADADAAAAMAIHAATQAEPTGTAVVLPGSSPAQTPTVGAQPGEGGNADKPAGVGGADAPSTPATAAVNPTASSQGTAVTSPNALAPLAVFASPAASSGAPARQGGVAQPAIAADRVAATVPRSGTPARPAPPTTAVVATSAAGTPTSGTTPASQTPATPVTASLGAALTGGTSSAAVLSAAPGAIIAVTASGAADGSPTATPAAAVTSSGHTPATPDAMAASIVAMYRSGQSSLVLRLDPPGLGAVSVHVALGTNADVNVLFVPTVAQTGHLLQSGLGDLRQAMANSGLNLGQAQIGSGSSGGSRAGGDPRPQPGAGGRATPAVAASADPRLPETMTRGARAIA